MYKQKADPTKQIKKNIKKQNIHKKFQTRK